MSKHIFHQNLDGTPFEVQIGWDKPLQQYYGNILTFTFANEPEGDGYLESVLWSDDEHSGWPLTLSEIAHEITKRGFNIPDGLLDNVKRDRQNNVVNKHCFYETPPESAGIQPPAPSPF